MIIPMLDLKERNCMNLFELKDYKVTFSPQALLLKPFKDIWDADKTKDKIKAITELGIVYYMADVQSDFAFIQDGPDRIKAIVESQGLPNSWKMNKKIETAIEFYKKYSETASSRLLVIAKKSIVKLEKFLEDVKLSDSNIKNIFDSTKRLPELNKTIEDLEEQISKQMQKKSNARGSILKAEFEDGFQ